MNEQLINMYEAKATEAFSEQASVFDLIYGSDKSIQYKRQRVRDHVLTFLKPGSSILELNAGTGEDALFFAGLGHHVHATDYSTKMLDVLTGKVKSNRMEHLISTEYISFTNLENLQQQGPYDLIFSNFAGLNCTSELNKVMNAFNPLLKPGGYVTLVVLPRFCAWETLMLFKGKFKTAFRRFTGKSGTRAKISLKLAQEENTHEFRCWYYNPGYIRNYLKPGFEVVSLEGLCTLVPPSYIEHFSDKYPRIYKFLESTESKWKACWPWHSIGDYYIMSLKKKS